MTERRNQGILSIKDRNKLKGSHPVQYPPHFRSRTREKLKQGLADLAFTAEELEDDVIAEVFDALSDPDLQAETTYTYEAFTRKTIVNALALFIQATDLVGEGDDGALETLVRDAIVRAYHRTHPRQVVGSVTIEVETAPRPEAYDHGYEKYRAGEWLNTSEMRALIDAGFPTDENSVEHQIPTKPPEDGALNRWDLIQYTLDHLDDLESGLELSGCQQQQSDRSRDADIICEDRDGRIVLINILKTSPSHHHIEEFESLIEENGGSDRVRVIVISPYSEVLTEEFVKPEIDVRAIQIDRFGTILGFINPTLHG